MANINLSRRTGALLAGVLPPSGMPLPQQTLGVGTWLGTPQDLADPALRGELLRLASLRRELRTGHLLNAAGIALKVRVDRLPADLDTTRVVAILRSVGAAYVPETLEGAGDLLRASLNMLGPVIPPLLLDALLAPESRIAPGEVERACLAHEGSPATLGRLRVLLVRRAAQDHQRSDDDESLKNVVRRVGQLAELPIHPNLRDWAEKLQKVSTTRDWTGLDKLVEAVGHNLSLTDPKNGDLHERLSRCFEWKHLESETSRRLARLSFSAWCTLRDATDGTGGGEIVAFSAQAAAFRQVFEVLLERALLRRFLRAPGSNTQHGLLDAVQRRNATIGLGRWYWLLFSSRKGNDGLLEAVQDWFRNDHAVSALRDDTRFKDALGELLRVRLHALPHDEEAARSSASEVLDAVARVGFGASNAFDLPKRGEGLVGQLGSVAL